MTINNDAPTRRPRWPGLRAWCVVAAVAMGLSQAVAAHSEPASAAPTSTSVDLHLADLRQAASAPAFLTSLWNWLLRMVGGPCQDEFVCGRKNSPVIDGATIGTPERLDLATRSSHEVEPGDRRALPAVASMHVELAPLCDFHGQTLVSQGVRR